MRRLVLILLFLSATTFGFGQEDNFEYPSLSPLSTITQNVGFTDIYVEYERPSARDRVIFGELVPWNEVWRTGAGYATKIRFSTDVIVGGKPVAAGYYSLLSIPNPDKWTIILNSDTTLYGSYKYKQSDDVVRFEAGATITKRYYESLTIDIDVIPDNARIYISWKNIQTSFLVETATDQKVMDHIKNDLMSDKSYPANDYANAATYLQYNDGDLDLALELANRSVQADNSAAYAHAVRLEILVLLGKYDEARDAAETAKKISRARTNLDEAGIQSEIDYYDSILERIRAESRE